MEKKLTTTMTLTSTPTPTPVTFCRDSNAKVKGLRSKRIEIGQKREEGRGKKVKSL